MLLLVAIQLSFDSASLLEKIRVRSDVTHVSWITSGDRRTGAETPPRREGSLTWRLTSRGRMRRWGRWRSSSDPAPAQSHSESKSRSEMADLD